MDTTGGVPRHPLHRTSRERGTLTASAEGSRAPSPSSSVLYSQTHNHHQLPSIPSLLASPIPPSNSPSTSSSMNAEHPPPAPTASLDANLRQLALLQALVARQQAIVAGGAGAAGGGGGAFHGHPATIPLGSSSTSTSRLVHPLSTTHGAAPLSTEFLGRGGGSLSNDWTSSSSSIEGLNFDLPLPSPSVAGAGEWPLPELASAQQQLDLWSQTVFQSDSPSNSNAATPAPTSPSTTRLGQQQFQQQQQQQQGGEMEMEAFDWSSLYTTSSTTHASHPHPHPHSQGFPTLPPTSTSEAYSNLPLLHTTQQYLVSTTTGPAKAAAAAEEEEDSPAPSSRTRRNSSSASGRKVTSATAPVGGSGGMTTRGGGRRGSSRAVGAVKYVEHQQDDEEMDYGENDPGPLQHGTAEEIEEDKRRRNTAASARFRAKKKQKDMALQNSSVLLRERVGELEKEKGSLKAENQWLKGLISERAEISPKVRELLSSHSQRG